MASPPFNFNWTTSSAPNRSMEHIDSTFLLEVNAISGRLGVQPDDFVLWREGSIEYRQNRGLDVNNDGVITKGEAAQRVRDRLNYFERR